MYIRSKYRTSLCSFLTWLLVVSFFLPALLGLIPLGAGSPGGWWNTDWSHRRQIKIDHTKVGGVFNDFAVLIDLTDISLISNAQVDGRDIVFVDDYTGVKLSHEIESFDHGTGHVTAWVKVPSISPSVDTVLYMYYGNPTAGNQQSPTTVWESSYAMVQHLNTKGATQCRDSTINGNNGTLYGNIVQGAAGQIDGAYTFDGTTSFVQVPHSNTLAGFTNAFTASFWIKLADLTRRQVILNKYDSNGNQRSWFIEYDYYGGQPRFPALFLSADGINYRDWYASVTPTIGSWYYVTVVWQKNTIPKFYINGLQVPTGNTYTISQIYNNAGAPLHIGKSTYATGRSLSGGLDEICLSTSARSSDWILTSYRNQKDPSTFYTVGSEETYVTAPTVVEEIPQNGAADVNANPTLSIKATDNDPMTIFFSTNATGTWQDITTYTNVVNGTYTCTPAAMNQLSTKYFWSVNVTDGTNWTNRTYSFTTTSRVLSQKWLASGVPIASIGAVIGDVNNDGQEEIVHAGTGGVVVLNGSDGHVIWSRNVVGADETCQAELSDINNDGQLEIIVPIDKPAGIEVLFGNGTTYWRRDNLGGWLSADAVSADIDGNGYKTIFAPAMWTTSTANDGILTSLSYDGRILHQITAWHPCAGGLSIADTDNDGQFELYYGDRNSGYGDGGGGKGLISLWAANLTVRWNHPEILCSSNRPMLADVNKDGILDVIIGHHSGGIGVFNSKDGSVIRESINLGQSDSPVHYQPSVYDIDGDGNLEMLMSDGEHVPQYNVSVWDLVDWKLDAKINVTPGKYGPQVADLTGDGQMDIILTTDNSIYVYTYNRTTSAYDLVGQVKGLTGRLMNSVVQDIDGDGYNEVVVAVESGYIYAFDTPARTPTPRPRSEIRFYSERRNGAAEFVSPPGSQVPVVSEPSPADGTTNVPMSLQQISFRLTDFQKDLMNYTVTSAPNIGSGTGTNVVNGIFTFSASNLEYDTTYTWKVSVTDGQHATDETFTFTTESIPPWWNTNWQYRKSITIDPSKVAADQTNFPVEIDTTDNSLAAYAQLDGYDIVFTDANQVKLDHEIEQFDHTTGHLVAWVRVPFVSSSQFTNLYMYYSNPTCENQQNPTTVWDTNNMLVLHLDETHECRMWGMISNALPHDVVLNNLISAPSSLKVLGGSNRDGWGLVYYAGTAPVVARGPLPANTDPNFDLAANALADSNAGVGVGHVRARSQGGLPPWGDPHPFMRYKNGKWWAFAHNGNVNKDIMRSLIGPAYLAANPPTYGANWNDDANVVDSDLYSLWVLKCIEANNWNVTLGVAQAIKEMTDAGDSGAANFLLTDGETLWGFRRSNTLYYYYQATSPQYSTIASQPPNASQSGWVQLSDYNFITVTKNSPPSIITDIRQQYPTPILVDSEFSNSVDSADLRLNGTGQDWYESRNNVPALLFLDTNDVGGDTSKKGGFTASSSGNAYLTQEFSTPQIGTFSVQWDIYVDSILDISSNPDRAGWMMIGDDFDNSGCPNNPATERFVYLAFYKDGGGTSGAMDLVAMNSTSFSAHTVIASGLNLKQWYTIRVICNMVAKTYDVYVDGVLRAKVGSAFARASVTHISFAQWNDGAGAFYVDNVYAPARNRYKLAIDTTGSGSVTRNPGEASYLPATNVTLTATPNSGWVFSGWSGDLTGSTNPTTITLDSNKVVSAIFASQGYTLTVNTVGSGSVSKNPDQAAYPEGTVVTLTATPAIGWSFNGWSGDLSGNTNPTTMTMSSNKIVNATFTQNQYTLLVNTVGSGSVAKNPDKSTYTYSETVTLTASGSPSWFFSSWSGDLTGSTNPITMTMSSNKIVNATFIQGYTLTINIVGSGSVARSPNQAAYSEGTVVTLTAAPAIGWSFNGWSGDLTGSDNLTTITMSADKSVTATFTPNQYTLTVTIVGGGLVTKNPDKATYVYGETVKLTAIADPGWTFGNFSCGCDNPFTITIDADRNVTATFIPLYALTVNVVGSGSVTKSPDQATYAEGSVVALTAAPAIGWSFSSWSGDFSGNTNPATITMNGNKVVTATFIANQYTLTVNIVGTGSVAKNPSKSTYAYGETVTLTASAGVGWSFFRWSGDLSGSANPATITFTGNKVVTATFVQGTVCFDSTVNGNNGAIYGGVTRGAAGIIDGAYTFDGTTGYIEVPHSNTLTGFTQGFTASFWLKLDDITRRQALLCKYNTAGNQRGWFIEYQTHATYGKVLDLFVSQDGVGWQEYYTSFTPVAGTWYCATVVWQTNAIAKFYINGVQTSTIGSGKIASIFNNAGTPLHIGKCTYTTGRNVKGSLDEIRISNIARSSDYILACYNNQKDPSTFYHVGEQESLPGRPIVSDPSPADGATNVPVTLAELSFTLTDYQNDPMNYDVTTTPNIGARSAIGVGNGRYSLSVSGLQYSTTYTWQVHVTDGTHTTDATYTFTTASRWLVDSEFSNSVDTADLIANGPGQDWYESRNDLPTLLFLDTNNVGGDASNKAGFTASSSSNAYLTQEFSTPQTGTFSVQWDIYVSSILDISSPDRAGIMLIGSDLDGVKGPSSADSERFVFLAFFKDGGATSGTTDLVAMSSFSAYTTVASGLNMKQWYTIKVIVNVPAGTYDIYLDGAFKTTKNAVTKLTSLTHISFAQWNDGAGAFYVDNVFSPAVDRYKVTINTSGSGVVTASPAEASYAVGRVVTLTATPALGWSFTGWSGDLTGSTSPASLIMDGNKVVTATFTQNVYTLTVNVAGSGSIAKNPDQPTYTYGDVITLTATANPGWTFIGWSGDLTGSTNPSTTTMNANKTVTATFTRLEYTLTAIVSPPDGGSVTLNSTGPYHYGDTVQLTAAPATKWTFSAWSGDAGGSTNPATITINGNKTVTATFTKNGYTLIINIAGNGSVAKSPSQTLYDPDTVVTLTAIPSAGWSFSGWSGDLSGNTNPTTITMNANKTVGATFIQNEYSLTVTVLPVGSGSVSLNQTAPYHYGDKIELTAVPGSGWSFSGWSGDLSGSANPASIAIDGNKSVTATFTQLQYTLTVTIAGSGSVSKSPDQPTYTYNAVVTLTATPQAGWLFSQWSGDLTGSTNPATITINGNKVVTATFIRLLVDSEFTDSVDSADLRANGAGQDWYESRAQAPTLLYLDETNVAGNAGKKAGFTASSTTNAYLTQEFSSPQTGIFSVQWDIYVDSILDISSPDRAGFMLIGRSGTSGPNRADADRFVYLAFYKNGGGTSGTMDLVAMSNFNTYTTVASGLNMKQWYTIRVVVNVAAGTYDVYVDGVFKATKNGAAALTSLTHISFAQWNDGAGAFYVDNVHSPALDRYKLTVNTIGSGSVTKNPGESTYAAGSVVTLTATPASGWAFSAWSGGLSGSVNPATVTMDSDKTITATFTQNQYTLTVNVAGSGSVTKSPDKTTYNDGEIVTLTAVPSAGWVFSVWSGDLTGNTNPSTITMTGNKAVTATFTQGQYSLTVTISPVEGGSVSLNSTGPYNYGDWVELTAVPATGWSFEQWSGALSGTANPSTILIDGNKFVTANFVQANRAPIIDTYNPATDPTIYEGESQKFNATYHDEDGDTLTVQWLLNGSSVGSSNEYTFTADYSASGTYNVTFEVSDGKLSTKHEWKLTVVDVGPTLLMPFDSDQSPIAIDKSGYGNNGTIYGATWVSDYSGCYFFNATKNNYIVIPDAASLDGAGTWTEITIEFWIKPTIDNKAVRLVEKRSAGNSYQIGFQTTPSPGVTGNQLYWDVWTTVGYKEIVAPFGLVTGVWSHVVCTYNSTVGMTIYVNGVAAISASHSGTITDSTCPVSIGRYGGGASSYFTGYIDDLRLYTKALPVNLIQKHYSETGVPHADYTLTTTTTGSGTVGVNPVLSKYPYAATVTLTAVPSAGWSFNSWSGDLTGSINPATLTIIGNSAVTATFVQNQYTLTVDVVGSGSVGKDPDKATYAGGEAVTLTATPSAGWSFTGWSGDLTGNTNPTTVTMDANKGITATFTQEQYTLTVTVVGNGQVGRNPDQPTYTYGASITLTATPDVGWSFSGWSGGLTGSDNPATITITGNTAATATFTQGQYTLTVSVVGSGSYAKDPDQTTYTYGAVVQLSATPASGWMFSGWSGDLSGSTNPVTITMDKSKTVAATFLQILLTDSSFDDSVDNATLRANGSGQDWYESRNNVPTLLFLDTNNIGGNTGKKAGFTASSSGNAYLSQEFISAQTSTFTVQWDIYVDSILDISGTDRAGWMMIGDDSGGTNGPNSAAAERFVYMGFYRNGGGTSGTMDLIAKNTTDAFANQVVLASGLNLKQWYTIRVVCDLAAKTYQVYVDGVLVGTVKSTFAQSTVTHISFAQWNDGAGAFYVDNVYSPTRSMQAMLASIDSGLTSPTGNYRWMDIANQTYSSSYRTSYNYSQASVTVNYNRVGKTLNGKLIAQNLKPNFAYQFKLAGTPGTADNELIGLAGRWWQEEWNGTAWTNGQNLNDKGTGYSPNPNDNDYLARKSITDSTSPTGLHYRYTGYLLFGYFITDTNGYATLYFETGGCYHVLWQTTQRTRVPEDGPLKTVTFDPVLSAAYDVDYASSTVSIFGEWERLPMGSVNLATGNYNCQVVLTEESFHGTGTLEGNWAAAMSTNISFTIAP